MEINVYNDAGHIDVPDSNLVRACVEAVLQRWAGNRDEVAVRFVELDEMRETNLRFREKDAPTNVLAFTFEDPPAMTTQILGDIIVCPEVVHSEAEEQEIRSDAHFAHMIVHGALHLIGYDHETDAQAAEMEKLEIEILGTLGYDSPY